MSSQYIFTMYKLFRTHPPDKQVLKDISLSFMPGAKIGVLGLNGSGKSTLLRIMAGQDTEYRGDALKPHPFHERAGGSDPAGPFALKFRVASGISRVAPPWLSTSTR